ncbi:hypothetical protein BC835DRAFT_510880 [Cytidiella melzeri]|nr:hypothetical protein BC835DRAFT_510880 [Cytidiella melzeri]
MMRPTETSYVVWIAKIPARYIKPLATIPIPQLELLPSLSSHYSSAGRSPSAQPLRSQPPTHTPKNRNYLNMRLSNRFVLFVAIATSAFYTVTVSAVMIPRGELDAASSNLEKLSTRDAALDPPVDYADDKSPLSDRSNGADLLQHQVHGELYFPHDATVLQPRMPVDGVALAAAGRKLHKKRPGEGREGDTLPQNGGSIELSQLTPDHQHILLENHGSIPMTALQAASTAVSQ